MISVCTEAFVVHTLCIYSYPRCDRRVPLFSMCVCVHLCVWYVCLFVLWAPLFQVWSLWSRAVAEGPFLEINERQPRAKKRRQLWLSAPRTGAARTQEPGVEERGSAARGERTRREWVTLTGAVYIYVGNLKNVLFFLLFLKRNTGHVWRENNATILYNASIKHCNTFLRSVHSKYKLHTQLNMNHHLIHCCFAYKH